MVTSNTPSAADDLAAEGIVEITDGRGLFANLLDVYERRGFDHGYRQAVHDVLASLVAASEAFLRERGSPGDLRRVVYQFEAHLEKHLHTLSPDADYVSEGLGI